MRACHRIRCLVVVNQGNPDGSWHAQIEMKNYTTQGIYKSHVKPARYYEDSSHRTGQSGAAHAVP